MTPRTLLNPELTRADTAFVRQGPVVTKLAYGGQAASDGTTTGQSARTWFDIGVTVTGVRVVYTNFIGETPGANAINVKANIELVGGTPSDSGSVLTSVFFNGQRTVTIQPGGIAISDVVPVTLTKGVGAYIRNYVSVATLGQTWPMGKFNDQGGGATLDRVTSTDTDIIDTVNPTGMGNTFLSPYMPSAILGVHGNRTILTTGDSITFGAGTTPTAADTRAGGYVMRAFKNLAGVINVSLPAERADQFISSGMRYRMQMAQFCTDTFCAYGNNDVHQGTNTFATVAARLQAVWALLAGYGLRLHVATITPRTTSTDAFVTTVNQTAHTQNSVRVTVNNWIRAGAPQDATTGAAVAPGTAGAVPNPYIQTIADVTDAVETTRDSGIWKANYTGDGTHPNATAGAAMAATVPTVAILTRPAVGGGGQGGLSLASGRAEIAAALSTARNIDGRAFDGTANITVVAPATHAATSKPTPVDADEVPLADSAASFVLKKLTVGNLRAAVSAGSGQWQPSHYGYIAWAYDPTLCSTTTLITAGLLYVTGIQIPAATTVTNIVAAVGALDSGLAAGQNFAAIYQGGTLLGATADQQTNWATTGLKIMPIAGGPVAVAAGLAYVGWYAGARTTLAFSRTGNALVYPVNGAGITRAATANSGLTTSIPSTLGALTTSGHGYWTAIS